MKSASIKILIILIFLVVVSALAVYWLGDNLQSGPDFPSVEAREFKNYTIAKQLKLIEDWGRNVEFERLQNFIFDRVYEGSVYKPHQLAHKLGEVAVLQKGPEGLVSCDKDFRYGCFHGASIQIVRTNGRLDRGVVQDLSEICKAKVEFPGQCIHGLGHAIVLGEGYDIPASFSRCDILLDDPNYREHCYEGVAMENAFKIAGNQYQELSSKKRVRYSCSKVKKNYRPECAAYDVANYIALNNLNAEEGVDYCFSEYELSSAVHKCISSVAQIEIGRIDDSGKILKAEVLDLCKSFENNYDSCLWGAGTYFAWKGNDEASNDLCERITVPNIQNQCKDGIR